MTDGPLVFFHFSTVFGIDAGYSPAIRFD